MQDTPTLGVAGLRSAQRCSLSDIQLLSKNKMMQNSTLLSYVKNSAFDMLLIEVVMSFTTPECAEHITKIYEQLGQFQAIGCDILLTKGAASGKSPHYRGVHMRNIRNCRGRWLLEADRRAVSHATGRRAIVSRKKERRITGHGLAWHVSCSTDSPPCRWQAGRLSIWYAFSGGDI